MIAAHLPHIPQIPEWDVPQVLPIRGFFTMHDICTALIKIGSLRQDKTCSSKIKNRERSSAPFFTMHETLSPKLEKGECLRPGTI